MSTKRALASMTRAVSPPPAKKRVQSATTKSALSNFFTPASKKPPSNIKWNVVEDTLLVCKYTKPEMKQPVMEGKRKIAGFDLDGTLIKTKSGNRFAKGADDWQWWHEKVPGHLRELYKDGYQIVVFTNQAGLKEPKKESAKLTVFKLKVSAILTVLDIPLHLYAATVKNRFRKPQTGMWSEMIDDLDLDHHGVDLKRSYLVGDAAGREGDFSDSDRHWAMNLGIGFHTPEEYFLGETARDFTHTFNPADHLVDDAAPTTPGSSEPPFTPSNEQEILVFCGSPGAGKSTYFRRYLEPLGYGRVNQDLLKTRPKCLAAAKEFLKEGKSVAIDNTNADSATREIWIALAKDTKTKIRCLYFTAPPNLCQHNDAVRAFGGDLVNPEKRTLLPGLAFNSYKSRFQEPKMEEGFSEVVKVDFKWQGTLEERKIWGKYYI